MREFKKLIKREELFQCGSDLELLPIRYYYCYFCGVAVVDTEMNGEPFLKPVCKSCAEKGGIE
jgi:hypothetical protein